MTREYKIIWIMDGYTEDDILTQQDLECDLCLKDWETELLKSLEVGESYSNPYITVIWQGKLVPAIDLDDDEPIYECHHLDWYDVSGRGDHLLE